MTNFTKKSVPQAASEIEGITGNQTNRITAYFKHNPVRCRIVATLLGSLLGIPCLIFLLYGTQALEAVAMQNQPWGSGFGMAALLAGLFCYLLICLISGHLSGYGLLPLIAFSWIASLLQSHSQSFWFWNLWITLGWSSFLPLITAIFMGTTYAIWHVRYESRVGTTETIEESPTGISGLLPNWIKTLFITFPFALVMALALFVQARNITPTFSQDGRPVSFLLSSSALPALTVIATMVISFCGFVLSACNARSVFSTSISSFVALIIPGLLISFVGLFSLGANTEFTVLQTWNVCSAIMGITGSLVVISGVAVVAAGNRY